MKHFVLGLAFAMAAATSAYSASAIDVDNLYVGDASAGWSGLAGRETSGAHFGSTKAMQTWTVGQSGRLDRIDLFTTVNGYRETQNGEPIYSQEHPNYFEKYDFNVTLTILGGGSTDLPGTIEFGSVSRRASEISSGGVSSFDLASLGIEASAGEILTLEMSVDACTDLPLCSNGWVNIFRFTAGGDTSGYSGGSPSIRGAVSGLTVLPEYDMNFRTWMSAVPEPSSWALMIAGFGGAGLSLRASRRAARPQALAG